MSQIQVIKGDIVTCGFQYIAHQCNCTSTTKRGVAQALFKAYPYADTYRGRTSSSGAGTIKVLGAGEQYPLIINMYAQYRPGPPAPPEQLDSAAMRLSWFANCLSEIGKIPGIREVAMPYLIGCGLAGGDWSVYFPILDEWARLADFKVALIKLS